ncbi:hypothetical protein FKM82_007016 [Ascaphus truei]
MQEEDAERKRKLEAGKAKLAQFRQRKTDSQNASKKAKKKKKSSSGSKQRDQSEDAPDSNLSQSDEAHPQSAPRGAAGTAEFTIMRTVHHGEIIKHNQTYTIEPESEISTTADDYSSEVIGDSLLLSANGSSELKREEEFGVRETYSEHETQSSQTRLEVMEDELAGKQQEIEELNRELEEMRAAYGTEGLQQLHIRKTVCRLSSQMAANFMLQEFETAIKQRDGIITQLTTNLQQARKEKDEIMREFLELTEQSQKLKIQFQHLQAGETLRNTSRTSTASDLLHSKQQVFTYQHQLEEQEQQIKLFQKENEDYQTQIAALHEKIQNLAQVQQNEIKVSYEIQLHEKDLVAEGLKAALQDEEKNAFQLKERMFAADKSVEELREQLTLKNHEINNLTEEIKNSKQRERRSSDEIKQLMGTVEDLQKKHHKGTQFEADIVQQMELETQRKLEKLQAELDEMHGQQIVQMKQELVKQHSSEIEKLLAQHKAEVDNISNQTIIGITNEQISVLSATISELNVQLQNSNHQRNKMKEGFSQQLEAISSEKSLLQGRIEDLLQDLSFAREQIHRAKQSITEKESKLNEASRFLVTIEELKAQLAAATAFTKELESKHESEVTNYKIKLEMLEREKDAVLGRMAESQEAELEKLRTYCLFSHEEELSKLKEDLAREHSINIDNIKDNLDVHYKQQMDRVQHEISKTIDAMQVEKDGLITKQNSLMLETSKLKDLLQSMKDPNSEEMMVQMNELQKEVNSLRQEEKAKFIIEKEVKRQQLRIDMLENEVKDKDLLSERITGLEVDNKLLKDENDTLQIILKKHDLNDYGKNLSGDANSENLDLKNEMENLIAENKQLRKLELQLKEELERQKNIFSVAEKHFQVNYHNLQEEHACLLKIKEELEDTKNKQEAEYKIKEECVELTFHSTEEKVALKKTKLDAPSGSKLVKADTFEGGEVVEKDTTELMEKLEVAQHDKQELSLKLSDLSQQLQLKQIEINQLKEDVKSLRQERGYALSHRQELKEVINVKGIQTVQADQACFRECEVVMSNAVLDTIAKSDVSTPGESLNEEVEEHKENSHHYSCAPSHLPFQICKSQLEQQHVRELTSKLENESFLLISTQTEKDQLQQELTTVHQEQADMRLQLEAQRISLTQIHSAHLELINENFQAEKENKLCSLKEEMLEVQEWKIKELHSMHQQELQAVKLQQAGGEAGSCQLLTELLMKTIGVERDRLNQCLNRILDDKPTGKKDETEHGKEGISQESSCVMAFQQHIVEAQTVHTHLTTLLHNFLKEYKRMAELYTYLEKIEELQTAKEEDITIPRHILISSQASAKSKADVQEPLIVTASQSKEVEKLEIEFSHQRTRFEEKHSQQIEHLREYFQQQLKENEERYTTEIIHLQEELQNVSETSLQSRDLSKAQSDVELGLQEADIFKTVYAPDTDVLKMDEAVLLGDQPLRKCTGPIYQQLQTLRRALYAKYVEEVNALKTQHGAELCQLKVDLMEKYSLENAALKHEIIQLTKAKQENVNGNFGDLPLCPLRNIEGGKHLDINQLLEERYRERIEEEIARVIVEMTIGFAQKTELARLATQNGESSRQFANPHESTENVNINEGADEKCQFHEEEKQELQIIESRSQGEMQLKGPQTCLSCELPTDEVGSMESITLNPSKEYLSREQDGDLSLRNQDTSLTMESHSKEKTVVLKEEDYNQMVAMGAESAKLKPLYEQHVEDMRQELVRQVQDRQQATETMRQAHMAQLERQMQDQEQLLSEIHMLRAQLAENASVTSESQAMEREKMLLEVLESIESREKQGCNLQDNSTQTQLTQDEQISEAESIEQAWEEGGQAGEGSERSKETSPSDLTTERYSQNRANLRLLKILFEIVKTTGAVEETIGRHVLGLLDQTGRNPSSSKVLVWKPEAEDPETALAMEVPEAAGLTAVDKYVEEKDARIWSRATEEGLDLPLQLTVGGFAGININPEDEAQVLNISTRLQAAVEKLLEAINETSNQLEHAKAAQTELVRESMKRKQETTELVRCQEELQERLNEEAKAREHLALELSKAEGLLDGYAEERVFLEKQMQEKIDLIRHLEQELQSTGNRLQEFEQERQQIQEERELLSRQKNALKSGAAPAEQRVVEAAVDAAPTEELLEETEKLLNERIEVQRQAEKESGDFHKHVKVLETELEEQLNHYMELEQEKNTDLEDLRQKNLALEKQLEKTRKFLDEQAVDREHERDVFQQEIHKLEQQLKMPQRYQPVKDQQSNELEKLANHLKEKTDKCSELLLCKEQLHRDVQERNEEIEKMECRIQEVEQALLISADNLQKVEDRKQPTVMAVTGEMPLEAQLQVEREAIDRKEKEITNLEEQLEQFREELENKNEEVQQLLMQLEIQRKESATRLQELEQENKGLKDESENLQTETQDDIPLKSHHSKAEKFEEILLGKDQEIDQLNEQIGKLQTQLEVATDNKLIEEKNEQMKEYKSQLKCLKSDQECLKRNSEEEIEKLNEVIEKLQQELASIEQKVSVDFASRTEDGESGKHHLELMMAEKELLQQKVELNDTEGTLAKTKLEETKADVKLLKEELENLREIQDHTQQVCESQYDGNITVDLGNRANEEKTEEVLREETAQLLSNQLFTSMQETMQSTIHKMESELQELQKVIKEKDSELLQHSNQTQLLTERTQEIEQLNEVLKKLQLELAGKDQKISADFASRTENAESSKHHLEAMMAGKKMLHQKIELNDADVILAKTELETTKEELKLLKEELEKLKSTPESTTIGKVCKSKYDGNGTVDTDNRANVEEALLVQGSIHMESQLQELQKVVKDKDSQLLQYSNQTEALKKQTQEIEQLNDRIQTLQQNLASVELKVSVDFARQDAESGKHQHKAMMAEKELLQKTVALNGEEVILAKSELEETKAEVKLLKGELEKWKRTQENTTIGKVCDSKYDGDQTMDAGNRANVEMEALGEKTAQLLANQAFLTSAQETMQSTAHNMESQLQELQNVVKEKDLQLLQYSNQTELLKKQAQEIKQLNEVMETLQQDLANREPNVSLDFASRTEDAESGDRQLKAAVAEKALLEQQLELNGEEVTLAKTQLEETKVALNLLKEEFEKLKRTQENIKIEDARESKAGGDVIFNTKRKGNIEKVEEALREKTAQLLVNQALLTSVQDTMQGTISNMESQLQELQKVIKEKDSELLQYSNQTELVGEQARSERDQHDQMILAMEETLRQKVAAALVSEAQMKAIQVHTKLMQKTDSSPILEVECKGTQTHISNPREEEEAESKLSVLSLRLLQLEKQLADLHEQQQVEREHVRIANQQAAEKETKLCELQRVLENTKKSHEENCVGEKSETGESTTLQTFSEPSQSNVADDMKHELKMIKAEATATKEELSHYRELAEKLEDEFMAKETSIAHLQEDLLYMRKCLAQAEEKLACYMKREEQQAEQKKTSPVDVPDSVDGQGETPFDRKTSSSQTERATSVNNGNQTPRVHLIEKGVQNELELARGSRTSYEVTEIMEQYTEKIGQMQDLHAAEILDMEARHISEADLLRREQYLAVQALTEECEALKAVIEALRTPAGAVISESALSASYQFTDATSSDTSSDWSQGTYVVQGQSFDPASGVLRGGDEVTTDLLPNKIKNLLRAVHHEGIQVLSLTEVPGAEKDTQSQSFTVNAETWLKERKSYLETIVSLKDLIGKMQVHERSEIFESSDLHERAPDWRGELLRAIREVFCREQDVLLAAFHTQLATLSTCDASALVTQMQHRLQEQGMEQINSMDCVENADRRSLLLEIQELRAQLITLQNDGAVNPPFLSKVEDVINYNLPQDPLPQTQEIHLKLCSVQAKATELQDQLSSERLLVAEIKNELAQAKLELESTLKIQHKHFKELESLRMEVKQKTDEMDGVNDILANEQRKTRELQWALEKEKAKLERNEERGKEELEDLKMIVEDQRLKNIEISKLLEVEKQLVKELQERITSGAMIYGTELSQERSKVSELQAFLEAEKARSSDLVNALECSRGLDAQMQDSEGNGQTGGNSPAEQLLKQLQSQLDIKHNRIVELVSEMERYKLECIQLKQHIEEDRQSHRKELQAEQDAGKVAQEQAEELKSKVVELHQKLKERMVEVQKLQADELCLKETIQELHNLHQGSVGECGTERREPGQIAGWKAAIAPTTKGVQQQKAERAVKGSSSAPLSALNDDGVADGGPFNLDNIRIRLQQVSTKLKQLGTKASQRILFEAADDEDFAWSQNSIQEVVSQLQRVAVLSLQGENLVLPPGISTSSLTERLLTQNAELTGYVSRLTEEKNDLRNTLLKLEEEACRHRLRGPSGDHSYRSSLDNAANIDMLIVSERELWNKEKLNLQKSLKQTEAELSKVRAELRNEAMQRDLGHESENVALKRIYGKYLRSESFRKALVYQKKYLLLLLGGFHECEEATLALIARMGGQPSYTDLEVITNHSRAFTRFRSAVRVSIAISRMKFLVRRWQRVTGSSPNSVNRNGFGQSTGNDMRTDSPYLPTGSLELYGEQRHSSCRSRSGFESPRSTVNSQHRYIAVSADLNPCSHLQHYDPDRALTDYISRLEALQKRLGSVQSGSSTHTQTHHGTRR